MRRAYHVARADFLQRVRSRRFLVVLAVVAYLGYLVNVGQIELAYQLGDGDALTNVHGANTAAFVGLKAGMTGSGILWLSGFYLMKNALDRDRIHNVDRLVASTPTTDLTYLFGKWLSNVALGIVVLVTLGFATVVNHAVHGVGPTKAVALLGPIFAFGLPLSGVVGAISLFFESVDQLRGTVGSIVYFLLATFTLAGLSAAEGKLPGELSAWVRATDLLGHLAVYELTANAVMVQAPEFSGTLPSFGLLRADKTFYYAGRPWPLWIYLQRAALILPAVVVLLAATIPFERVRSDDGSEGAGWTSRVTAFLPTFGETDDVARGTADPPSIESMSVTPVEDRDAGSFSRLVLAELRLILRGRKWWWYAGAVALVLGPVGVLATAEPSDNPAEFARRLLLPLAFVWPIFLWSELGVRTTRHRMTDLVFSSRYPVRQLIAEWLSGVIVAACVGSGVLALLLVVGQLDVLYGFVGATLFAPSLAVAVGIWSRSSWPFEMTYLMLWYIGPLNGAAPLDFVGATAESHEIGIPLVFAGIGAVLFGVALARRKLELG